MLHDRFEVPIEKISGIEALLREQIVVPKPTMPHPLPKKDPDDQWVLAAALLDQADVLVTGDSHLLDIASEAPIQVLSPRGFWELLRRTSSGS